VRRPPLVLLLVLAASCGRQDDVAPPVESGTFREDSRSWRDDPAGAAWDLASWVPAGDEADAAWFDLAGLKADRWLVRNTRSWDEAVRARAIWTRTLKLPEALLGDVISVQEPVRFLSLAVKGGVEAARSALAGNGFAEREIAQGLRALYETDAEQPTAAWISGRLVVGPYDTEVFRKVAAVQAGREPSARTMAGVSQAVAGLPPGKGLPIELEAYREPKRRGPRGSPGVIATAGLIEAGPTQREVRTIVTPSETERDGMRDQLAKVLAGMPDAEEGSVLLKVQGAGLRIDAPRALGRGTRDLERAAREDLRVLEEALSRWSEEAGRSPTSAEGLGVLTRRPELLDGMLGELPRDPWGRAYAYQLGTRSDPEARVIRSLGRDGEIDTEDDVLPSRD
jgi:hypothetical protein